MSPGMHPRGNHGNTCRRARHVIGFEKAARNTRTANRDHLEEVSRIDRRCRTRKGCEVRPEGLSRLCNGRVAHLLWDREEFYFGEARRRFGVVRRGILRWSSGMLWFQGKNESLFFGGFVG